MLLLRSAEASYTVCRTPNVSFVVCQLVYIVITAASIASKTHHSAESKSMHCESPFVRQINRSSDDKTESIPMQNIPWSDNVSLFICICASCILLNEPVKVGHKWNPSRKGVSLIPSVSSSTPAVATHPPKCVSFSVSIRVRVKRCSFPHLSEWETCHSPPVLYSVWRLDQ